MTSTVSLLALLCVCACVLAKEDLTDRKLELAEELAEGYRETYRPTEKRTNGPRASDQISGYNKPSPKARKLHEDREVNRIQTKVLELLGGKHADSLLRDLKAQKRASSIDYCTVGSTLSCDSDAVYRTMDGTCNNPTSPEWGMALAQHKRRLPNKYDDSVWRERVRSNADNARRDGKTLPIPRSVSNVMHKAEDSNADLRSSDITHTVLAWGQFVSHDMLSTPEGNIPPSDKDCCVQTAKFCMEVQSPNDDYFPPTFCMAGKRSDIVDLCSEPTVQNQYNQVTSLIDGSTVYGSSDDEIGNLRTYIGGQLKFENNFPPTNDDADPCVAEAPIPCILAGDHRVNVDPQLGMMHILMHREHNRLAHMFADIHDDWNDETIFQESRKVVGAMMQQITYGEYLPQILDSTIRTAYGLDLQSSGFVSTYDDTLDPTVSSSYAIVNRWGHSLIPNLLKKLNDDLETTATVNTKDAFSTLAMLFENNYHGIDSVARFIVDAQGSAADRFIDDSVRNKLFENSTDTIVYEYGNDLMSFNLKREREWGVPFYFQFRELCNGVSYSSWDGLRATGTHSDDVVDLFESLYIHDYRDIDLLTGVLTEIPMTGSLLGPTLNCMLAQQYKEVKDGDRFWFENSNQAGSFPALGLAEIRKVTLGQLICRNFDIANIRENVFSYGSSYTACTGYSDINVSVFGS